MLFPGSTEICFITIISPLEQFLVLVPCFGVCGFFVWLVGVGWFVCLFFSYYYSWMIPFVLLSIPHKVSTITPGTNRIVYAIWCKCRGNYPE